MNILQSTVVLHLRERMAHLLDAARQPSEVAALARLMGGVAQEDPSVNQSLITLYDRTTDSVAQSMICRTINSELPESIPFLLKVAENTDQDRVRKSAVSVVVWKLSEEKGFDSVSRLLASPNNSVRRQTVRTLRSLLTTDFKASPELSELLERIRDTDPDERVRNEAGKAVGP